MLLYLKSKDELTWPWQINMQQHTPNSNTISLPLFFPQILPTFTTGYGSVNQKKEKGLLLYCCHLCALLSGLSFQILKHKHTLEAQQRQSHRLWLWQPNALQTVQSPSRSGSPILVSTIMLYGTESSSPPIFFKLFVQGPESNYSLKELNWHFCHQDCGAVVKCSTISEEPSGTWCQLLIHRWQSLP